MSQRANTDEAETLFSFELLVEVIRIERGSKASDELALALRLLDFPTLLINQPSQSSRADTHEHGEGEHVFNRGKSCFFKMSLDSLHAQLSSSPLYAMVLDVKEEVPRLVGSSLISLAAVMDKIRQDVTNRGASTPSSHGERGLVGISNLMGEKVGTISLSYKLLSLGASLLPHVTDSTGLISTCVHREHPLQGGVTGRNMSAESSPSDKSDMSRNIIKPGNTSIDEDKQDRDTGVIIQPELNTRRQTPQNVQETENNLEEDLTVFCPPRLLYCSSAEETSKHVVDNSVTAHLDAFTLEDSEEETTDHRNEGASSAMLNQEVRQSIKVSRSQETSGSAPNVLRENLQQLPLLNALLVELSQLNNQSPHQPTSIHPNLAWIYRPASAELENTPKNVQNKLPQTIRPITSPNLKHLHPPRRCSTPLVRSPDVKVKDSKTSPRQKLVYGTTKTFNLRLKQNSSLKAKHRECVGLIQAGGPSNKAKRETKTSNKIMRSSKEKSAFKQRSSLNENIETMMQSQHRVTVTPALQGTVTLKQKSLQSREDRQSLRVSGTSTPSERDLKCIRIPSVNGDSVAPNKDEKELHSESDQSQPDSDRHSDNTESSGSSRRSSPRSSFSHFSSEGREEADYADDFNSLEPSDTYSPDPASSPEPSRAKTPRSPVRLNLHNSDSGSEGFQRRALHPAPIKALRSPQRTLMGTHIIQPRTNVSALSFSSDDGVRDGSGSLQTICSRKQRRESGGVGRSSGADSLTSSRGQRSDSAKNNSPLRGLSTESVSSYEPPEAEELEDELGSLDFEKEYQHISQLVAAKLPGYTM